MSGFLPDLALALLLVLTAFWCALVHHRLRRLRTDRGEIEAFVAALAAASERAETAIAGLREAAAETDRKLTQQAEAARQRTGELARLLDSGSRLARRLEAGIGQGARALAAAETARDQRPSWQAGERAAPERPAERPAAPRPPAAAPPDELLRALESLR